MNAIEKLKSLLRQKTDAVTDKKSQVEGFRSEYQNKKAEVDAAAAAGDYSLYHSLSVELKELEDKLYVSESSLKNTVNASSFTPDDVMDAWADYVKDYRKRLDTALKNYEAKRKDLYNEYLHLVELQNVAMTVRNDCGDLIGLDASSAEGEKQISGRFDMPYIPDGLEPWQTRVLSYGNAQIKHPDPLFFRACGVCTDEDLSRLNTILRLHQVG